MKEECIYSKNDVSSILGISPFTLESWYRWEKSEIKTGEVKDVYLPQPIKIENAKGRPKMWSLSMIDDLRIYQGSIVHGRNGKYGKYTNVAWH